MDLKALAEVIFIGEVAPVLFGFVDLSWDRLALVFALGFFQTLALVLFADHKDRGVSQ